MRAIRILIPAVLLSVCWVAILYVCFSRPAIPFENSQAQKELDAFLETRPPFPCLETERSESITQCIVESALRNPRPDDMPSFAILKYGSKNQNSQLAQILDNDDFYKIPTLLVIGDVSQARHLIKRQYKLLQGNYTKDVLTEVIYRLVDSGHLDEALEIVKYSPELIKYAEQVRSEWGYSVYCMDCRTKDYLFPYLIKALILAGRYDDAEKVTATYEWNGLPANGCSEQTEFARYAYYSSNPAIRAKHRQYCECRLQKYLDLFPSDHWGDGNGHYPLMKANCVRTYPDIHAKISKLDSEFLQCRKDDPECLSKWEQAEKMNWERKGDLRSAREIALNDLAGAEKDASKQKTSVSLWWELDKQIKAEKYIDAKNTIEALNARYNNADKVDRFGFANYHISETMEDAIKEPQLKSSLPLLWQIYLASCAEAYVHASSSLLATPYYWPGSKGVILHCMGAIVSYNADTFGGDNNIGRFDRYWPQFKGPYAESAPYIYIKKQ